MLTKEQICHKYFNDIKPKHLKEFKEKTPKGNIIEGVICKKPNHYLGSMLIQKITWTEKDIEFETEQFVQAMPKIEYYSHTHKMYQETVSLYNAYEKLDGSCLILYALYYNDEIIEIIPKTRGIPIADNHIISMYNEFDHSNINEFFEHFKDMTPTLLFELFGVLNLHSIYYPKTRIDIRLIGATYEGLLLNWNELEWLCAQYDFEMPQIVFKIIFMDSIWKIKIQHGIFYYYLMKNFSEEEQETLLRAEYPTQYDVISAMKEMITLINKNFLEEHGKVLMEGVVIDSYNHTGDYFMYTKVKSAEIEERCRTENGVPRRFVLKEVHKYFDEYGSTAKDIYRKDENHVVEYVKKNLAEEFDKVAVDKKKTKTRIINVFLDMLEAKEPPKGLQDICHSLVEEYPDMDISDLMRVFAQEYPEKKRDARLVYSIFEKIA